MRKQYRKLQAVGLSDSNSELKCDRVTLDGVRVC